MRNFKNKMTATLLFQNQCEKTKEKRRETREREEEERKGYQNDTVTCLYVQSKRNNFPHMLERGLHAPSNLPLSKQIFVHLIKKKEIIFLYI